jgi:hydroxymethylbilane synthase
LGIECREGDEAVLELLAGINDPATRRAVLAERAALAELEGGCVIPMAAWGRDAIEGQEVTGGPSLVLDASVFDPDGRERVSVSLAGALDDPAGLGRRVAAALRELGAERILRRGE